MKVETYLGVHLGEMVTMYKTEKVLIDRKYIHFYYMEGSAGRKIKINSTIFDEALTEFKGWIK